MAEIMQDNSEDLPLPEWLDHSVFPFRRRQIRVLNHQIHFVDEGDGPPLLMLHGNGSWSFGFRLAIPALSTHFRVIALDYPGFGLSRAAPNFSFLPEEQSKVVEAFVDALDLRDIYLFVEDWGGPIGLGLAGRRPEIFQSLIITNTWAWPAQGSPQLERFSNLAGGFVGQFFITQLNILGRLLVPNLSIARKLSLAERRGYYMPYPTSESRRPQAIFPREILGSKSYLEQVESGLASLENKPVLIIWGEGDPGFGKSERDRFLQHFPHAKVLLLPEAKHFVLVDEPKQCTDTILAFAEKVNS